MGAFAALAVSAVYGLIHERLFFQDLWSAEGVARFLGYTAVFWAAAGLIVWLRPAWLAPLAGAFVFLYSMWWCWRFFNPLAPIAVLYFLGSAFFLGRRLARGADWPIALLMGLAIWIFLISIAAHFPINNKFTYAIVFSVPYFFAKREDFSGRVTWPRAAAIPLYVVLAHWLVALKPEVSSDGLAVHLAIPAMVARHARFAFDFRQYTWALMPAGGDWAFTAAYLLGGEAAARLLNFAMLALIVVLVYRVSRQYASPAGASIAAALFASTPLVQLVTGSLFVENVWAALILGAAVTLARGELAWAGLLLGAAFSVKIGTSAYLAPAAAVAIYKARGRWRSAAFAALALAVFAAPPYLNAWRMSRNPMYPFANQVFKSPYFDASSPLEDVRYQKSLDWRAPYEAAFRSGEYFEGQSGSLGFQYFVLPIPLLILLDRRAPRVIVALGAVGALITFATLPNIRYVYPALPLLAIGFAWMNSQIPFLFGASAAFIVLNLWFLPASGWYHKDFALFTKAQFEDYLEYSAPQRKLVDLLNRTAPGEPVAFIHGGVIAGLDARGYSDTWHTYKFWKRMIESKDPGQIAALFREIGIRHLITPLPVETEYPVVERFVAEWTAPGGAKSGRYALRILLDQPVAKARDTSPAPAGSYDDVNPKIEYTGAWMHDPQFKQASGASITYSNQPGDSLRFFFAGRSITYVYTKA
ncbi:MAG TPA: hypothetical protein VK419_11945, partial [Bryobacteraceae bacterium]|nr:hypothetical protein [Bryobacteraceae bacterium]